MEIVLKEVRLAFAESIYEPKLPTADSKSKRYAAVGIIEPGSANDKLIRETINKVLVEGLAGKKGVDPKAVLEKITGDPKTFCYLMKAKTDKNGAVYDGFEGTYSLSAGQDEKKGAPIVTGPNLVPVKQGEKFSPYSGCYVNMKVDIWFQDNAHGYAMRAQLKVVQFVRDGDAFGGGKPPSVDGMEAIGVPEEMAAGAGLL